MPGLARPPSEECPGVSFNAQSSSGEVSECSGLPPVRRNSFSQPRIFQTGPSEQTKQLEAKKRQSYTRPLPSRNVSDETFDDAFETFILYCNPTVSGDVDTAALRAAFKSLPRSDGKTFSPFALFELVRKLEGKELKTWAQLVTRLGVEPPVLGKGQSTQKIQQYAVRLKRWMHAMHVDAFFEYLLDKPHVYWTQIPAPGSALSESGRDGVPPEEDLALRALFPETRPKRGRRKADEKEKDNVIDGQFSQPSAQRVRLHSPPASEVSAIASFSLPNNVAATEAGIQRRFDPQDHSWDPADDQVSNARYSELSNSATPAWSGNDGAWQTDRLKKQNGQASERHSETADVRSAAVPTSKCPFNFDYVAQSGSAITSTTGRSRRQHDSAVASAWPANSSIPPGKPRGKPPSNRDVADGSYSTFTVYSNSGAEQASKPQNYSQSIEAGAANNPDRSINGPQHASISFADSISQQSAKAQSSESYRQESERAGMPARQTGPPSNAQSNGQSKETTRDECRISTSRAFTTEGRLVSAREPEEDRTNIDKIELACTRLMLSAKWYDVSGNPTEACTVADAIKISKWIFVEANKESTNKEIFLLSIAALAGAPVLLTKLEVARMSKNVGETNFMVRWTMKFGAIEGSFTKTVGILEEDQVENDAREEREAGAAEDKNVDWQKKYFGLRRSFEEQEKKMEDLKNQVVESVVAAQDLRGR
ncbi:MAG: hypothetical protein M1818_003965 [Claussenomyces sp. TS43310]|nr:MAG: hypothetical protein M1818_003965 [Claussenomyces sp. TS43310]